MTLSFKQGFDVTYDNNKYITMTLNKISDIKNNLERRNQKGNGNQTSKGDGSVQLIVR